LKKHRISVIILLATGFAKSLDAFFASINFERIFIMKKLLAVLLACAALTSTAVGCGSKDSSSDGVSSVTEEAKSPEIGKWEASGEALGSLLGDSDYVSDDNELIMELKESGDVVMDWKYEYNGFFLDDDYFIIVDGSGDEKKKEIDYDGKYIYINGKVKFLERVGENDEDNIYGEYKFIAESYKEKYEDYILGFESNEKTYMKGSKYGKYIYDEENKTLSFMEEGEDHDEDPYNVEFKDDKMILTDSDGKVTEFTSIN